MEEKTLQLLTICRLAAIIAGFAMIAFLEFSYQADEVSGRRQYVLTVGRVNNNQVKNSLPNSTRQVNSKSPLIEFVVVRF